MFSPEVEAGVGERGGFESVWEENLAHAGFGPVCGRVEMVVGLPRVFGGRGGNELSSWSDSPHVCLPHVQSRPSWPRFAAMNLLILLSFSARLPPGGSLKIVRNSSSSTSLKLPMADGGAEKGVRGLIFCESAAKASLKHIAGK